MSKTFNVSANCNPNLHYMVDISSKLKQIKDMVDKGEYFTINRARQYGKTTTIKALERFLDSEYTVVSLDFQRMSTSKFKDENTFSVSFSKLFLKAIEKENIVAVNALRKEISENKNDLELLELFELLSDICKEARKPLVLMIDEVDSASNNQVFLDFLAQLRGAYITRNEISTFQSVILAGVYDIKNIKRKLRQEEDSKLNSPWNTREDNEPSENLFSFGDCPRDRMVEIPFDIASDFLVDMSFSVTEIAGMLTEYENDYKTGMGIYEISKLIYDYTSGYPFLVSRICKLMDERVVKIERFSNKSMVWTRTGFLEATKILLSESNTLFESLINKVNDYPELEKILREILFQGKETIYVIGIQSIEIALMFGFVKKIENRIEIANRVFEILLYNLFLASPIEQQNSIYNEALKEKNQFIKSGRLDMKLVLERFVIHFDSLYGDREQKFLEEDGRRYFLLYLRPIINGVGNYYIEAQTRNMERTDVVVDYLGEQFVIEMKIWHGNTYHTRGEEQLSEYLDHYHLKKGYMLSFNFNKKKEIGVKEIALGDKILVEAIV
jgi:hypothetical protein